MKYLLGKASPMFVASGLIKIAGGIAVCLWPVLDFQTLVYLFGIPSVVQGSIHIITATHYRSMYDHWWVLFFIGIVYMAAGVAAIGYPDVTPMILMIIIAVTWSTVGFTMILLAWRLSKETQNEFGLFLLGSLSITAGIYLATHLYSEIFSILWIVVIYAFLIGILKVIVGIKAKAWQHVYFDDIME